MKRSPELRGFEDPLSFLFVASDLSRREVVLEKTVRVRVAGILIRNEEILLVRHEKGGGSYWLLPGGGVDFGESAAEALRREFEEEVRMEAEVGPLVLVHDSIPPDRHRHVLNLYFLVESPTPVPRVQPDAVLREARFHPLEAFRRLTVYPAVQDRVLEGLRSGWKGPLYLGNRWGEPTSAGGS